MSENKVINGVLAAYSFSCISGSKRDKEITKEVLVQKNAAEGAGAWFNRLFPPKACGGRNAFTELRKHLSQMRQVFYNNTFLFEDKIWRILPEKRIEAFKHQVEQDGATRAEFLLEEFISALPELKAKAALPEEQGGRGNAYHEEDYPTVQQIRDSFTYAVNYRPIPNSSGLNPALMQDAINELNELNARRLAEAQEALVTRFLEPLQKLSEQLKDPDKKKIRPVLESILEISELLPSLELNGNQQLITMAGEIHEIFQGVTPELLKEDEKMQKLIGNTCSQFVNHFGQLGKRAFA